VIRLSRGPAPQKLDRAEIAALTGEFKASGKDVWNKPYIREALLALSHCKCAYCEANISEESKYMEVEHFRPKEDFPDLVVDWGNLLPACKRCNVRKGTYNVDAEGMIVNPFIHTPQDHFYFRDYRLRPRDDIGRNTTQILYLNQLDRLVSVRMQVGDAIASSLEKIRSQVEDYLAGPRMTRKRNQITTGVEELLKQAQPASQFSALAATVLLGDDNYKWIKAQLEVLNLWTELDPLEIAAEGLALFP